MNEAYTVYSILFNAKNAVSTSFSRRQSHVVLKFEYRFEFVYSTAVAFTLT